MIFKLASSHMLELGKFTNITTVFWAFIILAMLLKFSNSTPLNLSFWCFDTLVWVFTKIKTVPNNRIYFNQKVTGRVTIRTAFTLLVSILSSSNLFIFKLMWIHRQVSHCLSSSSKWISFVLCFMFSNLLKQNFIF